MTFELTVALMFLLALPAAGQTPSATTPAAQSAMTEGAKFEARKQLSAAADSYRAAVKGDSHCIACLQALARVQAAMEQYKDAAATNMQAAGLEPDAAAKARDEQAAGQALFAQYFALRDGRGSTAKDPKRATASLKSAQAVLDHAVADDAANEAARMLRGRVLSALRKDEDASREFAACAALPGTSPEECARALRFAGNVAMAREEPAPGFTASTIDGKTVSLASLAGKVVLLDFWATWCKYCERDSDYVQSMTEAFPADTFVLLEVSVDENEALWRRYVKDKRLDGVQVRDEAKDISALFHVTGFPTYIVLDGEGSIRMRAVGAEEDMKAEVRALLDETKAAAPGTRTALPKPGGQ